MLRLHPVGYAQHERTTLTYFAIAVRPERSVSEVEGGTEYLCQLN
jgi:hypothetical protein